MSIKYSIDRKIRKADFSPVFWSLFFFVIFYIIAVYQEGVYVAATFFLPFMGIFFIIGLIGMYSLHMNYYNANKEDTLVCDYENKIMVFQHGNDKPIEFKPYQVQAVNRYLGPQMKKNRTGMLMWDNYNYCDISLSDGQHIIITSLLVPKIYDFLIKMGIDQDKIHLFSSWYNPVRNRDNQMEDKAISKSIDDEMGITKLNEEIEREKQAKKNR